MVRRWNPSGLLLAHFVVIMFFLEIRHCLSLNLEGLALLDFHSRVANDPYGAFASWNHTDDSPCRWFGVYCVDGAVQTLDVSGFALEGILAPELVKLIHLRSLVLCKNRFSGFIPKEIGELKMLELLDLRDNFFCGTIPKEIGGMLSLKRLLLSGNNFQGNIPHELEKYNFLSDLQLHQDLRPAIATGRTWINRTFIHRIWQSSLEQLKIVGSFAIPKFHSRFKLGKGYLGSSCEICFHDQRISGEPYRTGKEEVSNIVRRRLLEASINLRATPTSSANSEKLAPVTLSSGSFPAVTMILNQSPSPVRRSYVVVIFCAVLGIILSVAMLYACQAQGGKILGRHYNSLHDQLQKAFVSGVPKLNRSELESACNNFSNVIDTLSNCIVYKGTLPGGVEIAVVSTAVASSKDWSKQTEDAFRKKIDSLSRMNHKNFVNLLGFCEEDQPFTRMMVFEYASNGTLHDHLHASEVGHLDWNARVRIIVGIAYCLRHMHYELYPSMAHPDLRSNAIFLTEDYAAKVGEINFWNDITAESKISDEERLTPSDLWSGINAEANVYSFGIILLEIISGKKPYAEEQGTLLNWATECLKDKRRTGYAIDPILKSYNSKELDIICEVIQECLNQESQKRPAMTEVAFELTEVIEISADAAAPKPSPFWWAELEILSMEAN